jgi:hypothetical protein
LDKADGELVGSLNVSPTGGAQSWQLLETNVSNATGVHRVYFVFTGTGTGNLFNFDYWQFTESSALMNMGDLNGDGSVNALDYALLKQHLLGTKTLSEDLLKLADLNQDKMVDVLDLSVLKQYLLGKITKLPVVG